MCQKTWRWIGSALVVSLLAFTGCGDDDPDDGSRNGDPNDAAASDAGEDAGSSSNGGNDDAGDAGPVDGGGGDTGGADADDGGGGNTTRDGLEGFCDHTMNCGSTYYEDADDCIEQSLDHWGECRRDELDTFGDCMLEIDCDEWGDPDNYDPSQTDCADEWEAVEEASC